MSSHPKTTILITGSSGFLGSKTIRYFSKKSPHTVIYGIDIRKPLRAYKSPNVFFLEGNLSLKRDCHKLDKLIFDYVIHTAADQSSPQMIANNTNQMKNLLAIAKQKHLKKFIFVSSSWADVDSKALYPQSKKICERLLIKSSIPYTIIRPDTLYGVGEWKMETIKKYAKKGFGLIVGSGNYLRSPTYVYDLISVFDKTIKEIIKTNNPRKFQKIYDIGSPRAYSQNQIVKLVGKYYGKHIMLIRIPKMLAEFIFTVQGKLDPKLTRDVENDRVADLTLLTQDYKLNLLDFKNGLKYLDYDQYQY